MMVVEYVPAFSTETDTGVAEGSVSVGPGWMDPPLPVESVVVDTARVGIGVAPVGDPVCWGAELEQPVVNRRVTRTRTTRNGAFEFIQRDSAPDYLRIPLQWERKVRVLPAGP